MSAILRIGNAQAFWGDDGTAAARLAAQAPDLDWLTLDYLAEVSMSILAKQRERDAALGYARDFVDVVDSLTPFWKSGRRLRVVSNAGGLNPRACAEACINVLRRAGCHGLRVGVVSGDDVLALIRDHPQNFQHLDTGAPLGPLSDRLVTASAYLGAQPVVEAIQHGADMIITGRVADPSLAVAPCVAHFGFTWDDYDRLAGATVAGHLIECGTQVTGGISTDWLDLPDPADIGFPIVEVSEDGSCVVTKPPGTGGRVGEQSVKEQLVYEIGNPDKYLSPDVTASFLSLRATDAGNDRVRVAGAIGRAPPQSYKVSATYRAGFRAAGMLAIFGRDAVTKGRRCSEIVLTRLRKAGFEPERWNAECLGAGDVVPGVLPGRGEHSMETVLRIAVADTRREVVERFTREMMPLITSGPQGTTGYAEGRPAVHEVFGYWPTLIPRAMVRPRVEILEV